MLVAITTTATTIPNIIYVMANIVPLTTNVKEIFATEIVVIDKLVEEQLQSFQFQLV